MSDKKLFVCTISIGVMLYAEDKEEAAVLATTILEEEVGNHAYDVDDFVVTDAGGEGGRRKVYAEGWGDDDVPYGVDDDESIGEIFKDLARR